MHCQLSSNLKDSFVINQRETDARLVLPGTLTTCFFRFLFVVVVFCFLLQLRHYHHGFRISSSIFYHLTLQCSSFQSVGMRITNLIKDILIPAEVKEVKANSFYLLLFISDFRFLARVSLE